MPAGWTLSSILCNDTNSTGDVGTATATFNVTDGDTVTCIFTNRNGEAVDEDLDTTFGISGTVTTDFDSGSSDEGNGVAIQTDGKIVMAGTSNNDFALVRYTISGTLDTSFGAGGKVTTDIDDGSSDEGNGVAIQTDGKIVVAGRSGSLFALVRYTTTGALDTSFGASGIVTADFASLGPSYQAASGQRRRHPDRRQDCRGWRRAEQQRIRRLRADALRQQMARWTRALAPTAK